MRDCEDEWSYRVVFVVLVGIGVVLLQAYIKGTLCPDWLAWTRPVVLRVFGG